MRKSELEKLVMIGKFDGKKGPCRPKTSYLTSLKKWLDPTASENTIIQATASKDTWRNKIANARTGHRQLTTTTMRCVNFDIVYEHFWQS